jgi:DUF4097 and DUF4098 domain-containing protein YvlB
MSTLISYPAEGVNHLIVEEMARDALVRGITEDVSIQVNYQAVETGAAPQFVPEGETVRLRAALVVRVILPAHIAVTIENANGDLRVQNLAGEVNLTAVHGDLRLVKLTNTVMIGQIDGSLRAEEVADLRLLGSCKGDLRFENGATLSAEIVAGDLRLHGAHHAQIGQVCGDLWAEKVEGALQVKRADGDARLSEIGGPVQLHTLAGDLRAGALTGGLAAPHVSGDAVLRGPFSVTEEYTLVADGDVNLHLPADADLRLTARASGRIRSDPPLTPAANGSPSFTARLGRGSGRINVTSRGDLRVSQAGGEARGRATSGMMGDLGERIRQQVSASLAAAGINIETGEVDWGWSGPVRGMRIHKTARPSAAERSRPAGQPPHPSSEEQMVVLQMVAEGKITAEEAETLLKALGG